MEGSSKKTNIQIPMGALSPFQYYELIKPKIDYLESTKGTLEYYQNYKVLLPEIEPIREKIIVSLPPMLLGTAMMKIALDYFKSLTFETEETDGTEIDDKYKIDVVAKKSDKIVVAQVKSGEISRQEFNEFCRKAPKFIEEFYKDIEYRELAIISYKPYDDVDFIGNANILWKNRIILHPILPETIITKLPIYNRHFKELKAIHQNQHN